MPRTKTKRERRSWSLEQRAEIIAYARENSVPAAAKHYDVARSLIDRWRSKLADLRSAHAAEKAAEPPHTTNGNGHALIKAQVLADHARWSEDAASIELESLRQQTRQLLRERDTLMRTLELITTRGS